MNEENKVYKDLSEWFVNYGYVCPYTYRLMNTKQSVGVHILDEFF
jgi:hypothetical protein